MSRHVHAISYHVLSGSSAYQNCLPHLQAIADGIAERLGLTCSIIMSGPMPKNHGEVGVRSVHSGTTCSAAKVKWPEFDSVGFSTVEAIARRFGANCYSACLLFMTYSLNLIVLQRRTNLEHHIFEQRASLRQQYYIQSLLAHSTNY